MKPTWSATVRRLGISGALLTLGAALLLLTVGCSGGPAADGPAEFVGSAVPPAAAPGGVDDRLWAELTAELKRVIEQQGTARRSAAAPMGFGSRVPDLHIRFEASQTVFSWSYRQHGDYDLNGHVTVSDLTQVGVHFGKTTLSPDWQVAQLADGDGNGEVNVSDVTPIGQNFGGQVEGYELQNRADPGADYTKRAELAFIPGDKLSGTYPQYSYISQPVLSGPEFRVVPFVDNGGGREYGTESNIFRTLTSNITNWHTARANNQRDGLSRAAGPDNVGETWETELEGVTCFQELAVDLSGRIYVGTAIDTELLGSDESPGYVYALDQNGEILWRFRTAGGVLSSPAASRLGYIVIGDTTGMVYCLAPDGKQLWRHQLSGLLAFNGPLLDGAGTTFIVSHTLTGTDITSSTLYKLASDGAIEWSRPTNAMCAGSPFFNILGEPTIVDEAGELYAFDYAGASTFNFIMLDPPSDNLLSSGMASRGSAILYLTSNDRLRINSHSNAIQAFADLGEASFIGPAINSQNHSVFGTRASGGETMRLNCYDGITELWDMDVPGNFMTMVSIDDTDRMYFGTFLMQPSGPTLSNGISSVLPDQTTAWFYPTGDLMPFCVIIADENLLVCAMTLDSASTTTVSTMILGIRGN